MAVVPKNITQELWKENALSIYETQHPDRVKNDLSRVEHITDMLGKLPTGRYQLEWAQERNVEIWLDYTCEGAGGYYIPGTNTVFLNAHNSDVELVANLSHEMRHCWQDHQAFLPTIFTDAETYLLQMRMIEADAAAIETQVLSEIRQANPNYQFNPRQEGFLKAVDEINGIKPPYAREKEALYAGFVTWFTDKRNRDFYDGRFLKTIEAAYELVGPVQLDCDLEYLKDTKYKVPENISGLDVRSGTSLSPLGASFNGVAKVNYLQDIADILLKQDDFVSHLNGKNQALLKGLKKFEKCLPQTKKAISVPYFRGKI